MKGRYIRYSKKQLAWIKRNRKRSRRDLHGAFMLRFRRKDITLEHLKALCTRKGFMTGRDGRLKKGNVPPNKGKKMPFNANSARTQFKKGGRTGRAAERYKPVGTERVSKDGYLERKIHDGLPMQSRWRLVHLVKWEALHGPIPAGMALKCLSHRRNTDPSNWELVPRSMLPRLNNRWGRNYDQAPADLKPSIMAIAKLEQRVRDTSRAAKQE